VIYIEIRSARGQVGRVWQCAKLTDSNMGEIPDPDSLSGAACKKNRLNRKFCLP
jgi:hypothetical protein